MYAIGLMSGTSLDGVTASLVEINRGKFKLIKCKTYPYTKEFKNKIFRNLNKQTARLDEISALNFEISDWFVKAIDFLLIDTEITYKDIKFVASHGQTIWHDPNGQVPNTLQIGEAAVIAYKTGITTISNFRSIDVAAGGQGAPLVPFSEYYLFKDKIKKKSLAFLNIGGMSNVTYFPEGAEIEDILAFDTGAGNVMIDYFTNKYFNLPYDNNGYIASTGKIIPELLEYLKEDPYIYQTPPKSTGREKYSVAYMKKLVDNFNLDSYPRKEDIITTVTEFTAFNIGYNYKKFLGNAETFVVSGGGSHNEYLMDRISYYTTENAITGDEFGIDVDSKESVAFAVMGYMTLTGKPSNVRTATGAKESLILGDITIGTNDYKF